jgi:hypothetical protein
MELLTDLVTVIPFLTQEELIFWNAEMMKMIQNYPEFENSNEHPVFGSFGAHGNPSSFHHPTVQKLRRLYYDRISSKLLPELATKLNLSYGHMLFDRVATRGPKTGKTTGETWHFDTAVGYTTFGGWINLNSNKQSQQFYCIKGLNGSNGNGYSKFPTEKQQEFERIFKGPVIVPPGHVILFVPEIVHKVRPGKYHKLDLRLYVGHVLLNSDEPLYNFNEEKIRSNLLPNLPSGELPTMWETNHWRFNSAKVEKWTETIVPKEEYIETVFQKKAGKSSKRIKKNLKEPVQVYDYIQETLEIMLPIKLI